MSMTTTSSTRFADSADGTRIAYSVTGAGPALVCVDGALCSRAMGPSAKLAEALAGSFTVHTYDRRGRGESGPGASAYDLEREIEDLHSVIDAAGGHAHVFSMSSGAALALEAARRGLPIDRLVGYEAPFILDDSHAPNDPALPQTLQTYVDAGKRGRAVATFLRVVGAPAPMTWVMRLTPVWRKLTAVAHTLPYDLSIVVPFEQGRPLPDGHYAEVACPVLMIAGGKSPAYMRNAQGRIAEAVPGARVESLPGQTHMVKAKVTGPVVREFLLG